MEQNNNQIKPQVVFRKSVAYEKGMHRFGHKEETLELLGKLEIVLVSDFGSQELKDWHMPDDRVGYVIGVRQAVEPIVLNPRIIYTGNETTTQISINRTNYICMPTQKGYDRALVTPVKASQFLDFTAFKQFYDCVSSAADVFSLRNFLETHLRLSV